MPIIALLTDFGLADEYVGVMKGAILAVNPNACIVDLCHQIPPRDIAAAARILTASFRYFPKQTIHVAVVDPGVGTHRAILAASAADCLFLAPDNGLLSPLLRRQGPDAIVRVENSTFFRRPTSCTFHGRDIFAPVAGHLSLGLGLHELGPPIDLDGIVMMDQPAPTALSENTWVGQVVDVDRFGNLITNLDGQRLRQLLSAHPRRRVRIEIGGRRIDDLATAYAEALTGTLLALVGSRDLLEIAVSGGSAAQELGCGQGAPIRLCLM
jgi:hypothetical protein